MEIQTLIKKLDSKQKQLFCTFCLDRVIQLYLVVDDHEDISVVAPSIKKGKAYDALSGIYERAKNDQLMSKKELSEYVLRLDPLILDIEDVFENTTENEVAMLVAQGVGYLLQFRQEPNDEYIISCSKNNLEILNQLKSQVFYAQHDDDALVDELLEKEFEKEISTQQQGVDLILANDWDSLNKLIEDTTIGWQ